MAHRTVVSILTCRSGQIKSNTLQVSLTRFFISESLYSSPIVLFTVLTLYWVLSFLKEAAKEEDLRRRKGEDPMLYKPMEQVLFNLVWSLAALYSAF